jgi:hypothetical protein
MAAKTTAKVVDPAKEAEKVAKFKEIGALRTKKALTAIRTLQKVANKRQYTYNDAQVQTVLTALRNEVTKLEAAFTAGKGQAEVEISL